MNMPLGTVPLAVTWAKIALYLWATRAVPPVKVPVRLASSQSSPISRSMLRNPSTLLFSFMVLLRGRKQRAQLFSTGVESPLDGGFGNAEEHRDLTHRPVVE